MASVSSLDHDMRQLRLGRYTPAAANEARRWIEETLGKSLPSSDLLQSLKDGVALCELANLVLPPPGIKFKKSAMPFIQMENISHFLKACEMHPLNLPAHDRFLTVDLFEAKDPAQVLQCLGAFSRQAHAVSPSKVRSVIGPKKAGGATMSPSSTGGGAFRAPSSNSPSRNAAALPSARAMSPAITGGSQGSQTTDGGTTKSSGPITSWSKRIDETRSTPAWNIHQYGYMGGANQGSQGVAFGARRQITTAAPSVPSLAEKDRIRKERIEEEARARQQVEREEKEKKARAQEEELQAKEEEERRWEQETKRLREEERQRIEEQKRAWEDDERRWKEQEEVRRKDDEQLQRQLTSKKPPGRPRVPSSGILRGQTLSQYQKELSTITSSSEVPETPEQARVRELEKQLEEARERERQYQAEREERLRRTGTQSGSRPGTSQSVADRPSSAGQSEASWAGDERDYLRKAWQTNNDATPQRAGAPRPLPIPREIEPVPSLPQRPLPQPAVSEPEEQARVESEGIHIPDDPAPILPAPAQPPTPPLKQDADIHIPTSRTANRTGAFLSGNPAPSSSVPRVSSAYEAGDTALEQAADRDRRLASQTKTKAGGWASKSLLEREMEKERERQREWEENQAALKSAPRDGSQGTGEGQTWDVNQYGYIGGDSQNKGSSVGSGIDFGGRRQIIGPRPP
ncbi:hypothetical protein K431DRAFT_286498, partial [Polychaeton citri CBS 116435]